MEDTTLTFEDGIILCKYIFQCAIHKTLHGVPEEWDIFFKTFEMIDKLDGNFDNRRLDDVLYKLNMQDVYAEM